MALNYFYGVECRWALNGVSCTAFGVASLIQNLDVDANIAEATYPNQLGNTAIHNLYDPKKEVTVTYIASNGSTSDGNMITSADQPTRGTTISLVDSIDSNSIINGVNYRVMSINSRRTATGVEETVARLKSFDNIAV